MGARDSGALCVHDFMERSRANGPGLRAVLWLQGCSLRCPGCFNPDTDSHEAGSWISVDELLVRFAALAPGLEGLTVSGGEPLEQPQPLGTLLERLRRETALSVILFTGYTWPEVDASPEMAAVLPFVDVLVAGRYDSARRLARGLRGSENKTTHFLTGRYSDADLEAVPAAEITIGPGGEVLVSGIDPPSMCLAWGVFVGVMADADLSIPLAEDLEPLQVHCADGDALGDARAFCWPCRQPARAGPAEPQPAHSTRLPPSGAIL